MSTNNFLRLKLKDFPDSVNGFNELFVKANLIPKRSEYKFYFLNDYYKYDINDLIIPHIKKDLIKKGCEEIKIFCEKIELKVNYIEGLSESIIINDGNKLSFDVIFEFITKEIMENLNKTNSPDVDEIIEKHDFYGYKKHFENFSKIVSFYQNKIRGLEIEKEVSAIILSNYEDNLIKIQKENEGNINGIANNQFINNLQPAIQSNSQPFLSENIMKLDDLLKSLSNIQNEVIHLKEFFDNKEISTMFMKQNQLDFFPTNDSNHKLKVIEERLNDFRFFIHNFINSLDLNKAFSYKRNNLKNIIFCNLCNSFKKTSNKDLKICERHVICESCYNNYSKKIKFLSDKKCFCKLTKSE